MNRVKEGVLNYFMLFGSVSTLLCCALPALLVSLGLGAVMAGLATNVPGLIWVSENKIGVFIFAGALLAVNGFLLWTNRNAPCPVDPQLRDACTRGRKASRRLYFFSLAVFAVGFFFAFLAPILSEAASPSVKTFSVKVTNQGFEPASLDVASGTDTTLEVTRTTDETCATEIQIPSLKIRKSLPLNTKVMIPMGILKKGEIRFGCGMNMMEAATINVK